MTSSAKKLEHQTAAGIRVRDKAVTRLSQRLNSSWSTPEAALEAAPETPLVQQSEPRVHHRAASAPPTVERNRAPRTIPDIVSSITAAINQAEGRHMQRVETLQIELVRATRDIASAQKRSVAALEQLAASIHQICTHVSGTGNVVMNGL